MKHHAVPSEAALDSLVVKMIKQKLPKADAGKHSNVRFWL